MKYYCVKVMDKGKAEVMTVDVDDVSSMFKSRDALISLFPPSRRVDFIICSSNYGLYDEAQALVACSISDYPGQHTKPCPFCGCGECEADSLSVRGNYDYRVSCPRCGAIGPRGLGDVEAIWNERK